MTGKRFMLYFHTLRYLRPVQIYGRVWFKLQRVQPDLSPAPDCRDVKDKWVRPAARAQSLLGPGDFRLLNQNGNLSEVGWDGPARSKLWRYNQHYFDDLNAIASESRAEWHQALVENWIAQNAPAQGSGWEPYPTSLRIVNWVKWALSGHALPPESVHSLAVQTRWLTKRIEWHLLGNHLFSNAKALVFAGLFFEGDEAQSWLRKGFAIFEKQIPEQILEDGGQFERSPMYHALALEDMLDLLNICTCFDGVLSAKMRTEVAKWPDIIQKMRRWLATMSHPDGRISFFNDAAFGVAPENEELERYASALGLPAYQPLGACTHLKASGYVRLQNEDAVLIFDAGAVGPDYLPGHAHADTLSFELSIFGERVFVNSGTSEYGEGSERLRQRGTAAHNTVTVDDENSSEVWGGFRVARRAKARCEVQSDNCVVGEHDGYARVHKLVRHRRMIELLPNGLEIQDDCPAPQVDQLNSRFYLYPDTEAAIERAAVAIQRKRINASVSFQSGSVKLVGATWHSEFGKVDNNVCLHSHWSSASQTTSIRWRR